jgi:hypothetical protein
MPSQIKLVPWSDTNSIIVLSRLGVGGGGGGGGGGAGAGAGAGAGG